MRALRISLVVLVVLAGLFIAADRVALKLTEDEAAEQVKAAQGVSGTDSASVEIHGFPFLTQLAARELDDVDVELTGMTAAASGQEVKVARVDAELSGVRVDGAFDSATADEASGTADVSYRDLNALAPRGVRVAYAGEERAAKNQVKITARVDVLGREFELPSPVYSTVRVAEGNVLRLHADTIPGSGIPGAEREVRRNVDFQSDVTGFPKGLELKEADVTADGVTFALDGRDVELTR
ncbi:LmeA family phospholipid-binding protein [Streptomyces sp. NPDC054784]